MCSFPDLEPVCYSMSSSNCCFLTCIQVSQEADFSIVSFCLKCLPSPIRPVGVTNSLISLGTLHHAL